MPNGQVWPDGSTSNGIFAHDGSCGKSGDATPIMRSAGLMNASVLAIDSADLAELSDASEFDSVEPLEALSESDSAELLWMLVEVEAGGACTPISRP